jgi:hypothetical protein
MAEVTRAQGQYNLQTAQAAQAAQQAYSQQLDNKLKATQTYFEMRKMNREYTQAEEAARRKAAGYGSPAIAPKYPTLTSSQLDPVTGEIGWTSALSDPYYSQYRKQFEDFFRARADHSLGNRSAAMEQLQIASNEMMAHLNQNIDSVRPQEWVDAKRLIEALMREARMPSS